MSPEDSQKVQKQFQVVPVIRWAHEWLGFTRNLLLIFYAHLMRRLHGFWCIKCES